MDLCQSGPPHQWLQRVPGTALGGLRSPHNWHWDPANLPNTYFALATLLILGDDLARVRRRECLAWVKQLQHLDGSFGEFLGEDGEVQGGSDPRLCMCAAGTIRILMGNEGPGRSEEIDQVRLQQYLTNCQVRVKNFSHLHLTLLIVCNRARKEGSLKRRYLKHIVSDRSQNTTVSFSNLTIEQRA